MSTGRTISVARRLKAALLPVAALAALILHPGPAAATSPSEFDSFDQFLRQLPEAPLPAVLSSADAQRYARIFELQRDGDWKTADAEIKRLGDRILLGHVLAQRYMHPTAYWSGFGELQHWLKDYADHPGAEAIHALALKKKPKAAKAPPAPVGADTGEFAAETILPQPASSGPLRKTRDGGEAAQFAESELAMQVHLRKGRPETALQELQKLESRHLLSASEADDWRRRIALGFFTQGSDDQAYALAAAAAKRSRLRVPEADRVAGLAAWRLARFELAARHFSALADSRTASSWDSAAGAYWAARAELRLGKPQLYLGLLERAAEQPRTFHGLLALRQLQRTTPFRWTPPALAAEDIRRLYAVPAVRRAVALNEAGQVVLAEREIRRLRARANDELAQGLLALAVRLETPAASLQLALAWRNARGEHFDAGLYPLPPWEPDGGFVVDRALVFAFMRQESAFNARAMSPAGARGLMQLMPRTASFVAKDSTLKRSGRHKLFAPEYNIELGQRYLQHLLELPAVRGNLMLLAAAYNAGPGNLQKWLREIRHQNDPLVFMEAIPSTETRLFVERVMTNFWIYRARLQQPSPALDAIAAGEWPEYVGLDAEFGVASNAGP